MSLGASIDGLVSGLDTSSIIRQLMQLERQPQLRLQVRQTSHEMAITALQGLNGKVAALRTAADKLTTANFWNTRTASASSEAVRVTAAPGTAATSVTFDVDRLAAAHAVVFSGTVPSTSTRITDQPTITITKDGTAVQVATGDGSLAGVAAAINSSNAGVQAAVVQVAPDQFRLQLTSTTTGASSSFTVTPLTVGGNSVVGTATLLRQGADAQVTIGTGSPGQYSITSATNDVELLTGLKVSLQQTATNVTVKVEADTAEIVKGVEAMVKAANDVLAEIADLTRSDPTTGTKGVLAGDSGLRSLQQQILGQVSAIGGLGGPGIHSGVELTREGRLTFDSSKLLASFSTSPEGTARLFRAGGSTSDPRISYVQASDRTRADLGPLSVVVTQAATKATASLSVPQQGAGANTVIRLVSGSRTVDVAIPQGSSHHDTAALLNQAAQANGIQVTATSQGGGNNRRVVLESHNVGSSAGFTATVVSGNLAVVSSAAGLDIAGTINGRPATGIGDLLTATGQGNPAEGLSLRVNVTAAEVVAAGGSLTVGTATYLPGLAQRFDSLSLATTDVVDGTLTLAIQGRRSRIDALTTQIASWDQRLTLREAALKRQFGALEVALGRLRDQSTWLAGQINSLPGWQSPSS